MSYHQLTTCSCGHFQFGNQLTDDELHELSTGRLINRLKLATNRPDGLDECTREMFSLAMLVRLGRITEDDVKATFAGESMLCVFLQRRVRRLMPLHFLLELATAFRRLDVGNYGTLNSRTIIEGELMRRRAMSYKNLADAAAMNPSSQNIWPQHNRSFSHDDSLAFSQAAVNHNHNPYNYVVQSPNPFMNPIITPNGSMGGRWQSVDSLYSSSRMDPDVQLSPSFDFEAYERWSQGWHHYDSLSSNRGGGY